VDAPEARMTYKACVAFDPTVKEQQEDELDRIRIDLRRRSRDVVQRSASRVMQCASNFSSSSVAELADDAFAVYVHRRLHNPHAFRDVVIPYDMAMQFISLPQWVDALETKRKRKREEQMRRLEEAMEQLQVAGRIYRNALIHSLAIACPRNVVMSRIGIVLDMPIVERSCVAASSRRKIQHRPAPRFHPPDGMGPSGSAFSCMVCVSSTSFIR